MVGSERVIPDNDQTERNFKMNHDKDMKVICLTILVLSALSTMVNAQGGMGQASDGHTIKAMTYNLKFASPTFTPAWAVRRDWQVDLIKKYGFDNWYDWRLANWGCKWNTDSPVLEEFNNKLIYLFDTPWGPPPGIYLWLCELFPQLEIAR